MANARGKILVIDDSRTVCAHIRLILEDAGFEVLTLKTLMGTVATITRERPNLVLLDVCMPALNGEQVVEFIRDHAKTRETFVVFHSVKPAHELEALARRCGADGYICKGDGPDALLRQVKLWLIRQSHRTRQLAAA